MNTLLNALIGILIPVLVLLITITIKLFDYWDNLSDFLDERDRRIIKQLKK